MNTPTQTGQISASNTPAPTPNVVEAINSLNRQINKNLTLLEAAKDVVRNSPFLFVRALFEAVVFGYSIRDRKLKEELIELLNSKADIITETEKGTSLKY